MLENLQNTIKIQRSSEKKMKMGKREEESP